MKEKLEERAVVLNQILEEQNTGTVSYTHLTLPTT